MEQKINLEKGGEEGRGSKKKEKKRMEEEEGEKEKGWRCDEALTRSTFYGFSWEKKIWVEPRFFSPFFLLDFFLCFLGIAG